jgi:hypothetical protein
LAFWQTKAFAFEFVNSMSEFWQTQTQTAVCVCVCVSLQTRLQKNSQMENAASFDVMLARISLQLSYHSTTQLSVPWYSPNSHTTVPYNALIYISLTVLSLTQLLLSLNNCLLSRTPNCLTAATMLLPLITPSQCEIRRLLSLHWFTSSNFIPLAATLYNAPTAG